MAVATQLFELLKDEIPGYDGAAYGSLDGQSYEVDGAALASVRGDLAAMARAWHQAWTDLGGAMDFGSNDEMLVSASKGYLLVKVHHEKRAFFAVALKANGNIGYLRFRMRDYLRRAVG